MKIWTDITKHNGVYVAKDVFKALAFFTGLGICIGSAISSGYGLQISTEPAVLLLLLSFGLQTGKAVENYFQRRTADDNGSPLAVPSSVPDAPVLMPTVADEYCADKNRQMN